MLHLVQRGDWGGPAARPGPSSMYQMKQPTINGQCTNHLTAVLPIDIRDCSSEATFKKHLKTFLFHVAFT